jgi:transcriptional regulator with XRE-family HTH domain|tara:strand:- start:186 stop:356 length:171 start_codon:yes stop_codon:yes gene_type:complete
MGSEIKELRILHGLKQRECAEIVGVGIRQWQKYEQGHPFKEIYLTILETYLRSKDI